jgi:outer membrane protein TolC
MARRSARCTLAFGVAAVVALHAGAGARAQGVDLEAGSGPIAPGPSTGALVVELPRVLELADRNHPNIVMARAKLLQARAQLDEARWAPFSQWSFTGGVGLAPTVRGNNVFSPNTDVSLTSSLGLAWQANLSGVVPLWTFGKITHLWEAAEANVKVNEATIEKERDAVRVDVRKAYFGLQLARDSLAMLRDVRKALEKAVKRLDEEVADEKADPIEALRLKTYAAELEARESEAERFSRVALTGLRFYTGVPVLDIPDVPLKGPKHQLGHVTRYLTAARVYRPEVAMAQAGIAARTAQVALARSQYFPDLGIGLSAGLSTAPEVADQINPYVTDPGNYFHYGFALLIQWKMDLLPQSARVRFAEAQLEEMRAQQSYALGGVGSEVEIAYAEVVDWKRRVDTFSKATHYAKQWLVRVQAGIDTGTLEDKELLEPARQYATQKFNMLNATMELDMAMSRLAKATGWDAIAPDGT